MFKHLILFCVINSFCLSASASFNYSAETLTGEEMRELRRGQVLEIANELEPHFQFLAQRMGETGEVKISNYDKDKAAIAALKQYATDETTKTIWTRYKFEVTRVKPLFQDKKLRKNSLDALLGMLTSKDEEILRDMDDLFKYLGRMDYNLRADQQISDANKAAIKETMQLIAGEKGLHPVPTFEELLGSSRVATATSRHHLDQFSEILKSRIIGQPEVIEALEALEWERQFVNDSELKPDIIYLMGSPGTGKDTAAEAFTDALHGKEGAYKTHMYRLPIMRERPDLWQVLGSATGYVGSETMPPFLKFLVDHSGGKYIIEQNGKESAILLNPEWRGEDIPGHMTAGSAVVFVNEFHNWSKELKDVFLKQALEKGIFTINNPSGGLDQIEVPVRFVIASNEGISLITSREANGRRHGKPLTYDQMLDKWTKASVDKDRLKNELMAGNGPAQKMGNVREGISEEMLRRIPDEFLLLMRPLSPEALMGVVESELSQLSGRFAKASPLHSGIEISWDEEISQILQEYDYNPENNAGPIKSRVRSMIITPLVKFFRSQNFDTSEAVKVHLSLVANEDGTKDLQINLRSKAGELLGTYTQSISSTFKDRHADVVNDEVIDRLAQLPEVIKSRVFGVDAIADRVTQRVVALANQTSDQDTAPRSASTIVLMGLSSTGKTELSKAIAEALTGDEKNALVLDFSQIQNLHDFQVRVLGLRDGLGNPISSDFMKHYDRLNGDVVVVLDELANVRDPELLKALYDFFREPIVSTFADGKDRVMSKVKLVVTGNAGIELYKGVPRGIPMEQQMAAWQEISDGLNKDKEAQRLVLEKVFPEPLITRWGRNNIFFVPPHTYKSLRQLTHLKLSQMIEKLKPAVGRRGWHLGFASEKEYEDFVSAVIEGGFNLREQGASIDSFIKDDLLAVIESKLLVSKIPPGSRILVKTSENHFQFYSDSSSLNFRIKFKKEQTEEQKLVDTFGDKATRQTLTAYHEVGHALSQRLLFEGVSVPTFVSILPGVTRIGADWVHYAGIAKSLQDSGEELTREGVVRKIAVFAAGETAERMVTKAEVHSAGKRNDMERATKLAEAAVVIMGFSESWGIEGVPSGRKVEAHIASFSEQKKRLFEAEVKKLIDEGRALAREVLEKNFESVMVPMSKALAEKGTLNFEEMQPFWDNAQMVRAAEKSTPSWMFRAKQKVRDLFSSRSPRSDRREGVFKSPDLVPEKVADIEALTNERKEKLYSEVPAPENIPVFDEAEFRLMPKAITENSCDDLLKGA